MATSCGWRFLGWSSRVLTQQPACPRASHPLGFAPHSRLLYALTGSSLKYAFPQRKFGVNMAQGKRQISRLLVDPRTRGPSLHFRKLLQLVF